MVLSRNEIDSSQSDSYLTVTGVLDPERLAGFRDPVFRLGAVSARLSQSNERSDLIVSHDPRVPTLTRLKAPYKVSPEMSASANESVLPHSFKGLIGPCIRFYNCKLNPEALGAGAPMEKRQVSWVAAVR